MTVTVSNNSSQYLQVWYIPVGQSAFDNVGIEPFSTQAITSSDETGLTNRLLKLGGVQSGTTIYMGSFSGIAQLPPQAWPTSPT